MRGVRGWLSEGGAWIFPGKGNQTDRDEVTISFEYSEWASHVYCILNFARLNSYQIVDEGEKYHGNGEKGRLCDPGVT